MPILARPFLFREALRRPVRYLAMSTAFSVGFSALNLSLIWGAPSPPIAKLIPQRMGPVNRFANHMAVDGNRVLVGAYEGGFIFSKPVNANAPWPQEQFLPSLLNSFGAPVALRGDVALLGDEGAFTVVEQAGAAQFWRRSDPQSPYVNLQTVWPRDSQIHDEFGSQVALGERIAFVGADNDDHNGKQSTGTVTLYRDNQDGTGRYEEVSKFAPADLTPGNDFGSSLAIDGDRLVVGAGGNSPNQGAAYLYERNAGGPDQWGQVAKFEKPGGFYGHDVSISGDSLVVSLYSPVVAAGAVDIYDRDPSTGEWLRSKRLFDPNTRVGDGYGYRVAQDGDFVAVAARIDSDRMMGEVFVYGRNHGGPGNWGLVAGLTSPDPEAAFYFGSSIALMDNLVLVGSLGIDDNPLGSVYVYAIPETTSGRLLAAGIGVLVLTARKRQRLHDVGGHTCSHSEHSS